jgi:hypothetical protein
MGITAAGFPANRRVVKASTWNMGVRMGTSFQKGVSLDFKLGPRTQNYVWHLRS